MKYCQSNFQLGSIERALVQLRNGDLIKALKTMKTGNIPIDSLKSELCLCLQNLYQKKQEGTILSGYYSVGVFGDFKISELLLRLCERKDYHTFLKQAYRFEVYVGFENEIEKAIKWHEDKNLTDTHSWRMKFNKIIERLQLSENPKIQSVEESSTSESRDVYSNLRSIKIRQPFQLEVESLEDPYIISQTAKIKTERANRLHTKTLELLIKKLNDVGIEVKETNLIDAFAVLNNKPAIFEVKSISLENERQQVRHAVSQLYEYRYLYSLQDASLWVVFSSKPSSEWLIEYLINDRQIKVLWVKDSQLVGSDSDEIFEF